MYGKTPVNCSSIAALVSSLILRMSGSELAIHTDLTINQNQLDDWQQRDDSDTEMSAQDAALTDNKKQEESLLLAIQLGNVDRVKILLDQPNAASIDTIVSANGDTLLHIAVENDSEGIIPILLDAGAEVSLCNTDGRSALDLARLKNKRNFVCLIEEASRDRKKMETEEAKLLRKVVDEQAQRITELENEQQKRAQSLEEWYHAIASEEGFQTEYSNSVDLILERFVNGRSVENVHLQDEEISAINFITPCTLLHELKGHKNGVFGLARLPNGSLISCSSDKTLRVWDCKTQLCIKILKGHTEGVCCLHLLPNGMVASGSDDKTVRIWDPNTGACIKAIKTIHTKSVFSLTTLRIPDGQFLLASGSSDGSINIWDIDTYTLRCVFETKSIDVASLVMTTECNVASGSYDGVIRIWNVMTTKCVLNIQAHNSPICCLCYLSSGSLVSCSAGPTTSLKLFNCDTGELLKEFTGQDPENDICWVIEGPSGSIITASVDLTVKAWSIETGEAICTVGTHHKYVQSLVMVSPGVLASCGRDKVIKLWKLGYCSVNGSGNVDRVKEAVAMQDLLNALCPEPETAIESALERSWLA